MRDRIAHEPISYTFDSSAKIGSLKYVNILYISYQNITLKVKWQFKNNFIRCFEARGSTEPI